MPARAYRRGLGDVVEDVAKATGIKKVVDVVSKGGCGCNKRRDALNKAFPFKNKNNGISEVSSSNKGG